MSQSCYYPNTMNTTAAGPPAMVPCNTNAEAESSACCAVGDACSANGLCVSQQFYFYRGGCTDPMWESSSCSSYCSSDQFSSGDLDYLQPITFCYDTNFTCSADYSDCASSNFSLTGSPIAFVNITSEPTSSSSSLVGTSTLEVLSSTTTATVTASCISTRAATTPTPATVRHETSKGVLAAAITVPLVLAAILLVTASLLFTAFKRGKKAEQVLQERESGETAGSVQGPTAKDGTSGRNELPTTAQRYFSDYIRFDHVDYEHWGETDGNQERSAHMNVTSPLVLVEMAKGHGTTHMKTGSGPKGPIPYADRPPPYIPKPTVFYR